MQGSKVKLIGEPLKFKSLGDIDTELKLVGKNRILSHSFVTSEGIVIVNRKLFVFTKNNLADVYELKVDGDIAQLKYRETRGFKDQEQLALDLMKDYQLLMARFSEWRFDGCDLDRNCYDIGRVYGKEFKDLGISKKETSGYVICYEHYTDDENDLSDTLFISDVGERSLGARFIEYWNENKTVSFIAKMDNFMMGVISNHCIECRCGNTDE